MYFLSSVAKGRVEPIAIFEVLDRLDGDERTAKLETREQFAAALAEFRAGEMKGALAGFEAVLKRWPSDLAAELQAARCRHFLAEGLPEDWDGVTRLEQK